MARPQAVLERGKTSGAWKDCIMKRPLGMIVTQHYNTLSGTHLIPNWISSQFVLFLLRSVEPGLVWINSPSNKCLGMVDKYAALRTNI